VKLKPSKSLRLIYLLIFLPVVSFNIPEAKAEPACGSGKNAYLLSVGSPVGSRQFAVACKEHDACYDTLGKSKGECDKAFHNRMLGICSRDHNTWFGRPLKIACNGRADAFYSAVNRLGKSAYDKAQKR
jgi:Group XII secretory phospholipase A2 precursor (PLA2G12)